MGIYGLAYVKVLMRCCQKLVSEVIYHFFPGGLRGSHTEHSVASPGLMAGIFEYFTSLTKIFSNYGFHEHMWLITYESTHMALPETGLKCVFTSFARHFFFARYPICATFQSVRHPIFATFQMRDIPSARKSSCTTFQLRDIPSARLIICVTTHFGDFFLHFLKA